ncbi:MAG: 50S ribosomal protein P1 [Candidatus Methanomethylicia archaeon]|nr:50S ribosomal protein P1 [Candidatus Methanomethylicia archaeon]MCX8169288.1 50S ribosomal protein P1 [Candidatus Methanomethylicia archaeon]MDW7988929.1 50S ribosomal protein P1 [Nitrososphaerota archaeon]
MEYIYASLLLHYAKKPLEEKNLRKVLEAAGIAVDEIRLKAIIAALKEINIDEAISAATSAMTVTAIPAAPVSPPTEGKGKVVEEDKKKEEKEEEEIAEGLAALFG